MLIIPGDHVPDMPLVEVAGKEGAGSPLHIGPIGLKVGIVEGEFTVTEIVAVLAHCPAVGVNV